MSPFSLVIFPTVAVVWMMGKVNMGWNQGWRMDVNMTSWDGDWRGDWDWHWSHTNVNVFMRVSMVN